MPASSPAAAASSVTIWPRVAEGRCGSAGVSPSMRRYVAVSSTSPYGSLATTKVSSARPTLSACPLPRSASRTRSGRSAAAAAIATEPSSEATVARNASPVSSPAASRRETSVGMTLASVVISVGTSRRSIASRSA